MPRTPAAVAAGFIAIHLICTVHADDGDSAIIEWAKTRDSDGTGQRGGEPQVGNHNSRIYHQPNCPSIPRMEESNRVMFGSAGDAEKAGFRKAGDCR